MKKAIFLTLGAFAIAPVFAQTTTTLCTSGVAQPAGGNFPVTANNFVVRSFPIRCSNNVTASSVETAVAFGVGTLSTKGKSYFQGNTGGGAISGNACGTTCTSGQELQGLVAAVNAAT